ncbi:AAA family ATPase [Paraburkholderia sp. BCC1884]|uniref:AAA family ATPase n=1 Tax=Paraburkholderia sp. BCC1884 TaxID=2562668 RepID=UPI001182EF33|nr:AAA family ATPase [Paraburkholderia sp. BCC1884]
MTSENSIVSTAVTAVYTEQRIPRYRNNQLIAALPPALDDEALGEYLDALPSFEKEQREWQPFERLHLVGELSAFMSPLQRHVVLGWALDTMLRQGYVGRAPRTADHVRVFQKLYEAQQAGKAFSPVDDLRHVTSQNSSALIGVSGQGKTTTLRRLMRRYPQAIYHPDLEITQITYIHIETPADGASIKGLAHSILRKIDQLVPDGNYYQKYGRGSMSVETMLNHVARVMHMHCVGLLIVDEIQNLRHGGKNNEKLMAVLVSASNELGVPILFVGTNRAINVLGLDFSQGRRSVGSGFPEWGHLSASHNLGEPLEWEDFVTTLWTFQWLKNPVELTQALSDLLFYYSQGIIDIAIKLLACSQWQAIIDGSETITAQLLELVWNRDFTRVQPMIDAYRSGDATLLDQYGDIAPIKFSNLLDSALNKFEGLRNQKASVRPGHQDYAPTIASALVSIGVDKERALSIADAVEAEGKAGTVLDGAKAAIDLIKPRRSTKRRKTTNSATQELAPDDYRKAINDSVVNGNTILENLRSMGVVSDLNSLLKLE